MDEGFQDEDILSGAETQRHLVFALLRPAMRLGRLFRLPLATIEDLCRMAYFEEVRFRDHRSQAETATLMGKSLRTIGTLEQRYRSDFLAPEAEQTLMREIEQIFQAGPATLDQVAQQLTSADPDAIDRAIASLITMKRLVPQRDGMALNHDFVSLVRDDLNTQLDGLKHQLDVIVDAVVHRFFDPDGFAMARTLSFVARREDMESLGDAVVRHLRSRCIDAEEKALKGRSYNRYAVTFALAPTDENDIK